MSHTGQAPHRIEVFDATPPIQMRVEELISGVAGIDDLRFNLIQRELTVQHLLPSIEHITTT